ncbi:alpha-mannosidase [Microcella sp.]|uniref:alpha-mannosidase n=1 Tax=Microcella sp. TaxID=1913979 RepID=UPI003F6F8494
MHDTTHLIQTRVERFLVERLRPALYRETAAVGLEAWEVEDEPVPFAVARVQQYRPIAAGDAWGRPWGTVWLRVSGTVPQHWVDDNASTELLVDLGYTTRMPGFQAEGQAYDADGVIIKALEPLNQHVPLTAAAGQTVELYIEAAGNPDLWQGYKFEPNPLGDKATAGTAPIYRLGDVVLARRDEVVAELIADVEALYGLHQVLDAHSPRRAEILHALDAAIDAIDPHDVRSTAVAGRSVLAPVLSQPAQASAHRVHAVGHAHIDSAWLWPVRETVRKVARTFSNVMALMDEDDTVTFAASSAQQYAWLKQSQPALFERLRGYVASGRFVPTGGMWVESDTNMPGGEALARQFIEGKRFFLEEFGIEPTDAWLPDSFGYSAALPQIVVAAGSEWLLTQKMTWNETNRMPHDTFWWEGIDGTRLFTHFPPVATYNSDLSAKDLARAEREFSEKGHANTSLVPFGYGNGGGGPTREMVAAARRTASLEGSPTVTMSTPDAFYRAALAEYPEAPVWAGEMYLELHRGTYTSQARTKRGNRRSEHLLREAELWATHATLVAGAPYPADRLRAAWQSVLTLQFHDILPGSSIAWVHHEAEATYAAVAAELERIIDDALGVILGSGELPIVVNAGPYALAGAPALGAVVAGEATPQRPVVVERHDGSITLTNAWVCLVIDAAGRILSVRDLTSDREVVPPGAAVNELQLCRDTPDTWDAWDISEHYRRSIEVLTSVDTIEIIRADADRAEVRIVRTFGQSHLEQVVSLDASSPTIDIETTVDWHERQKLLKLAFPVDLVSDRAASEIQFGHVHRPTHVNTSWDSARFETVAHRWVHVGEPDFGVAIANDATYGHDITRTRHGDRPTTTVRLSLLRAPLFPDPEADQGQHRMRVALRVGASIPDAVHEGYRLNVPLRHRRGRVGAPPIVTIDHDAVVVEAIKLADDGSADLIVRLYEAHGIRARARLTALIEVDSVAECDLLERPLAPTGAVALEGQAVRLDLRPFQLVTVRVRAAAQGANAQVSA